jgi:hypothetical protein
MEFEGARTLWKIQLEDARRRRGEAQDVVAGAVAVEAADEQKAKVGTLNFNKRYRNIAVDASRMVFKEEYVRGGWIGNDQYPGCLDRNYKVGDYDDNWRAVRRLRPGVGGTRSAKFCAHLVLAAGSCKDHERCYWVIDLERDQLTLPQQVDMVLRKHEQYRLQMVDRGGELGVPGRLARAIEQKHGRARDRVRIEPHYTTRTNKPDPETGVQSMAPWFERGACTSRGVTRTRSGRCASCRRA